LIEEHDLVVIALVKEVDPQVLSIKHVEVPETDLGLGPVEDLIGPSLLLLEHLSHQLRVHDRPS
jgi:hypothetical protein